MPLPVFVIGAIKAAAAAATWTTGEVVLVGTASAGATGGTITGIIYRNEIKSYVKYLFGYSIANEVRPLPAVIQNIENAKADLQQEVNNQSNVVKLNSEQSEIIRNNEAISEVINSRLQETSILISAQEAEFKNMVDKISIALDTSSSSITELTELHEEFRKKTGFDAANEKSLALIDTFLVKIQSLTDELSISLEKNQFYEEVLKSIKEEKEHCVQSKVANLSIFSSENMNGIAQYQINNPSLSI